MVADSHTASRPMSLTSEVGAAQQVSQLESQSVSDGVDKLIVLLVEAGEEQILLGRS